VYELISVAIVVKTNSLDASGHDCLLAHRLHRRRRRQLQTKGLKWNIPRLRLRPQVLHYWGFEHCTINTLTAVAARTPVAGIAATRAGDLIARSLSTDTLAQLDTRWSVVAIFTRWTRRNDNRVKQWSERPNLSWVWRSEHAFTPVNLADQSIKQSINQRFL